MWCMRPIIGSCSMRVKISYKLIAAVGFVAIVIIGIFAYVMLNAHQRLLTVEMEHSVHQLSETVEEQYQI